MNRSGHGASVKPKKLRPMGSMASIGNTGIKKTIALTTMVLPGAVWLLLIRYLPMFGISLAFKDYRFNPRANNFISNFMYSAWVGFDKFKFLFTTDAGAMIRNTLAYNVTFIVLGLFISLTFAIMLSQITARFAAKTYQTMMFFPYFISWVVVSYFVMAFLDPTNGILTKWQASVGMGAVNYYNTPSHWPVILTLSNIWKNTGYSTVLYLAAITGIDATQYEAAAVDGASKWQQIRHVTLPGIKTMIIVLFIMNVGKIFNADFGLFYSVPQNSGMLYPTTQVIDTYVYNTYQKTRDVGMTSAAGLYQNVIGFICIMVANGIVRKLEPESSLF
jgi:putative aldouronate transport system permease protein